MDFDFGPGERLRSVDAPPRSSRLTTILGTLALLLMVGACAGLVIASSLGYKFAAVMPNFAGPEHDFSKLYARYSMAAIPVAEIDPDIYSYLVRLEREPCEGSAATKLGKKLADADEKRLAANFHIGFSNACGRDAVQERAAANLFYRLNDFKQALKYWSDLVARFPENANDWYSKGLAEEKLGMHDDALQSYATMISLTPDKSKIGEWAFYEMAAIYAAKGQYCEAMSPIDTYVSIDPTHRDTSRPQQVRADYSKRGHCAQYAKGEARFPVLDNNVIDVRAAINGVTGTFAIDTGATFVTVTPAFAAKAGLKTSGTMNTFTANGDTDVKLSKATTITLGGLKATDVPLVVVSKPIGPIDGLLGRSLLGRYNISIDRHHLTLSSKPAS